MAILRIQQVTLETGHKSKVSIYQQIREGLFTKPVQIGERSVGWPDYEVQAIIKARIAGSSIDQLKALVSRLHANRNKLVLA